MDAENKSGGIVNFCSWSIVYSFFGGFAMVSHAVKPLVLVAKSNGVLRVLIMYYLLLFCLFRLTENASEFSRWAPLFSHIRASR